jgi:hypothetical protein
MLNLSTALARAGNDQCYEDIGVVPKKATSYRRTGGKAGQVGWASHGFHLPRAILSVRLGRWLDLLS